MSTVLERYESIPAPFQLSAKPAQSLRATDSLPYYLRPAHTVMPLWDLIIDGQIVRPAIPVGIRLRQEEDLFFAENDSLSIYAHGQSPEEAISDFKSTAAFFAHEYRATPADGVIGLAVQLRDNFLKAFPL